MYHKLQYFPAHYFYHYKVTSEYISDNLYLVIKHHYLLYKRRKELFLLLQARDELTSDYLYIASITNHDASTNAHCFQQCTAKTSLLKTICFCYAALIKM